MNLVKKANGESYKFASEELINQFINLCKKANTDDYKIVEMLESLEASKVEKDNSIFEEA